MSVWDRWYRRVLPAYWVFLFCATHLPRLELPGPAPVPDKLAHLVAFALLAFLFWRFVESFGRPVSGRLVWVAVVALSVYAAADEYLQSFVGRRASLADWACDVIGSVSVLALLEWRRRTGRTRGQAGA